MRFSRNLPMFAIALLAVAALAAPAYPFPQATDSVAARPQQDERPLPDIPALLRDVSKNQRAIEEIRKLYTCHLSEEKDNLDSDGQVESRSVKDYDVFYIGEEQVRHLLAKDGRALDAGEKKKEDERFNKQFDELKKKQAELATDPKKRAKKEEEDEAEISDFLRAERFTNPRRESFRGQEVIAFDFTGNPDYKPAKRIDRIIQKLSGVMWVDEQAREIVRLEARFVDSVNFGGGILASLHKGSNFVFEQEKINGEVWLPSYAEVHLSGRIVFVKLKRSGTDRYTDYKKFRVGAALGATSPN
ncbi:MAG TPA: hypothetical protein VN822_14045 [Candidatus Acidoferrales bacterium]|nr:hypothetical protein [Candidatus Acidoferrales bacterium]